jgi:glycosyltransferase involved in cell wall biosynthesis
VVPNGTDVNRIQLAPLHETPGHDAYDVLFAGRLIEDKNITLLLDAFDAVADRSDATLGIIGDGPEADRLQRQAQ